MAGFLRFVRLSCFLILSVYLTGGVTEAAKPVKSAPLTPFEHNLGINLSTWLSHTPSKSGAEAEKNFTKADFDELAAIGFDHIRLPVAENMLYTSGLNRDGDTFRLIDQLVGWCEDAKIKLIINFHVPRTPKPEIWKSQQERDKIAAIWDDLSKAFSKYPLGVVAYEIFNEPNCPDDTMWNEFSASLIKAIRKREPARVIVLGPNKDNTISKLPMLILPEGDNNLIVSVHFYGPAIFTHYGVGKLGGRVNVKLNYPGQILTQEVLDGLTDEEKKLVAPYRGTYTRETQLKRLSPVAEFAKERGVRVRVGEFGFNDRYQKASGDTTIQPLWTADIVSVFRELGLPHSFWGYKASFGLFNSDGTLKDPRIVEALTK